MAKLNTSGAAVWSYKFGDPADQTGTIVKVDACGNIAIGGRTKGTVVMANCQPVNATSQTLYDIYLARHNPAGDCLWSKVLGAAAGDERLGGIAVTGSGRVALSGSFDSTINFGTPESPHTTAGGDDIFLATFQP